MRTFTKAPVKAETDAEMTKRHMVQERILLETINRQIRDLVNNIESLSEASYEEMDLPVLYQELLDTLQGWPANIRRLKTRGLEEGYNE